MKKNILVLILFILSACGGGGGSDDNYAGTWDFEGIKVSDSCNLGLDSTISARWNVNQDEDIIAVESGSLFLNGNVNDEGNGWEVVGSRPSTCAGGVDAYAIATTIDKDKGTAGVALSVQCRGITCVVTYGGTVRRVGKIADVTTDQRIEDLFMKMSNGIYFTLSQATIY